jgi:hypothetical protein
VAVAGHFSTSCVSCVLPGRCQILHNRVYGKIASLQSEEHAALIRLTVPSDVVRSFGREEQKSAGAAYSTSDLIPVREVRYPHSPASGFSFKRLIGHAKTTYPEPK